MSRCKITVLKTALFKDLAEQRGKKPSFSVCPVFKEGDVFYTEEPFGTAMPEGFCHMAWHTLELPVSVIAGGGKFLGFEESTVASCMDGLRPVSFLIEKASD